MFTCAIRGTLDRWNRRIGFRRRAAVSGGRAAALLAAVWLLQPVVSCPASVGPCAHGPAPHDGSHAGTFANRSPASVPHDGVAPCGAAEAPFDDSCCALRAAADPGRAPLLYAGASPAAAAPPFRFLAAEGPRPEPARPLALAPGALGPPIYLRLGTLQI